MKKSASTDPWAYILTFILFLCDGRFGANTSETTEFRIANIIIDFDLTVHSFLVKLQDDMAQLDRQQLPGGDNATSLPAEVTSLFRTVLFLNTNTTINNISHASAKVENIDRDLAFNIQILSSGEIEVDVQFTSTSISEPEVTVFLDQFGAALQSIPLNLLNPLSEISLMSPEETKLVMEMNPAFYSDPSSSAPANTVMQLIEEQASRTPQKIAVCT